MLTYNSTDNIIIESPYLQLHKYQYPIDILIKYIDYLNIKTILKTQKKLTAAFCARYILNPKYFDSYEDEYELDIKMVLRMQPQISKTELEAAICLFEKEQDELDDKV
jgi:hypothetical protein